MDCFSTLSNSEQSAYDTLFSPLQKLEGTLLENHWDETFTDSEQLSSFDMDAIKTSDSQMEALQLRDQTTPPPTERAAKQGKKCPNCYKEADNATEDIGEDENKTAPEMEENLAEYEDSQLDAQKPSEPPISEEDASEASDEALQNQRAFFEDTSIEAAHQHGEEIQGEETIVEPASAELKAEVSTEMPPMRKTVPNNTAGTGANGASGSGTGDDPIVLDDEPQPTRQQSEVLSFIRETSSCISESLSTSAFGNVKNKPFRPPRNATPSRNKLKRNIKSMSQWTDPNYQEQLDSQVEESWTYVQIRWLKVKALAKKAANGNPCLEAAVKQFKAEIDTAYLEAKETEKVSSIRASSLHGSWMLVEGRIHESGYVSAQEEYEVVYEYEKQIVKLNESLKQLAESTNARHALRLDPDSTGGDDEADGDYGKPKRRRIPKARRR